MWNNDMVAAAEKALESGSIFGSLEEISARKINGDLQLGKVMKLGRFEVFIKTANHPDPYVTLELDGAPYSGYSRALGNQLINVSKKVVAIPDSGVTITDQKCYCEIETGLAVHFTKEKSSKGEYMQMFFGEPEAKDAK
jgi:hypothetical protein